MLNSSSLARTESDTFSEIFRDAPAWLLDFTSVSFDAKLLNFELPDRDSVGNGSGWLQELAVALLPTRIMTAGEPVSRPLFERSKPQKDVFGRLSDDDIIFLLEMRKKPEDEWSLTQRRRYSQIQERIFKK